jgi:hypothetical protein
MKKHKKRSKLRVSPSSKAKRLVDKMLSGKISAKKYIQERDKLIRKYPSEWEPRTRWP